MKRALGALVVMLFAVVGWSMLHPGNAPSAAAVRSGASAPATKVISAAAVRTAIGSGQPVVLLFFAPGCVDCSVEAEAVGVAVKTAAGASHVRVIGIDMGGDDDAGMLAYLDAVGLSSLPFNWAVDTNGSLAQRFNVQALSETVGVVKGTVRFTNQAPTDADQLRAQIAGLA